MKDTDYEDDGQISKSELKREAHRHQDMGKRLTELNASKWKELPITETLYNALVENARLKQHEAKRRHMQYIGRLMRDEDVDAIQARIDLFDPSSEAYGRRIKQQELWRTRLVNDPNALNSFIEEFPEVDRQALRNLVRNAQKEMSTEPPKPGTGYKKLFQFIKEQMAD
ncbi:ribosome biogenesis factor YjgA [Thalassolituus sp. LLYu03]|uniref:ribosome biogenesis factor YjgA n=1 Tax=Thalassolituus sp. LLYu03 TaxID=3421656 RepID=UPI003D280D9A